MFVREDGLGLGVTAAEVAEAGGNEGECFGETEAEATGVEGETGWGFGATAAEAVEAGGNEGEDFGGTGAETTGFDGEAG